MRERYLNEVLGYSCAKCGGQHDRERNSQMEYGCCDDWYYFKYTSLLVLDDLGDGFDYL